jgi:hypothetical protein
MITEYPNLQTVDSPIPIEEIEATGVITNALAENRKVRICVSHGSADATGGIGLSTLLGKEVQLRSASLFERIANFFFGSSEISLRTIRTVPSNTTALSNVMDGRVSEFVERMIELRSADEEQASSFAYENALHILAKAYAVLKLSSADYYGLPRPILTTDDQGGLRTRWVNKTREVRANFGASALRKSYLYFEEREVYGVEQLSPDLIARRLQWLLEA